MSERVSRILLRERNTPNVISGEIETHSLPGIWLGS